MYFISVSYTGSPYTVKWSKKNPDIGAALTTRNPGALKRIQVCTYSVCRYVASPPAEHPVTRTFSALPMLYRAFRTLSAASIIRFPRKYRLWRSPSSVVNTTGASLFPLKELPSQYIISAMLKLQNVGLTVQSWLIKPLSVFVAGHDEEFPSTVVDRL
eukprot:gene20414-biopygen20707